MCSLFSFNHTVLVVDSPKPDFLEDGFQLPDMDSKSEILTEDRLIAVSNI